MDTLDEKWKQRLEKSKQRLEICVSCDRLQKNIYMCKECGCFMKIKAMFPESECPLHKWSFYKEQ